MLLRSQGTVQNPEEEYCVDRVGILFVSRWQLCLLNTNNHPDAHVIQVQDNCWWISSTAMMWAGVRTQTSSFVRAVSLFISFQNPSVRFPLFYFCSSITFTFNFLFAYLASWFFVLCEFHAFRYIWIIYAPMWFSFNISVLCFKGKVMKEY